MKNLFAFKTTVRSQQVVVEFKSPTDFVLYAAGRHIVSQDDFTPYVRSNIEKKIENYMAENKLLIIKTDFTDFDRSDAVELSTRNISFKRIAENGPAGCPLYELMGTKETLYAYLTSNVYGADSEHVKFVWPELAESASVA